jgi:hypothetical protein
LLPGLVASGELPIAVERHQELGDVFKNPAGLLARGLSLGMPDLFVGKPLVL